MKFLVFNLAVIGALGYLILNEGIMNEETSGKSVSSETLETPKTVNHTKNAIAEVKKAAQEASSDIKNMVASELKKIEDKKQVPVDLKIKETSTAKQNNKEIAVEVPVRPVNKVPQHDDLERPGKITSKKNSQAGNNDNPEFEKNNDGARLKFMTAKERRLELNRLARDMEILFIKKLNK